MSLVRDASGLCAHEYEFLAKRKGKADAALRKWLSKTSDLFDIENIELPTIGLTTSGGGYRSMLTGAGVIQGMDERDSNGSTSGLFQAFSYQSGLSGGGWLLSSFAGNNYPTISKLQEDLWEEALQNGLVTPENGNAPDIYKQVFADVAAKDAAGFDTTLTDPYGRLLSYQFFPGPAYGANLTFSSVVKLSNFTDYAVPFPIIVSLGVKTFNGESLPGPNATIYEFTPFEFGSWDSDVSAFVQTKYLGTSMTSGNPTNESGCVINYDNLGYILGVSSNVFNYAAGSTSGSLLTTELLTEVKSTLNHVHEAATEDLFAVFSNPFYGYGSATMVLNTANLITEQEKLHLVDGGEALQNNPIWPMLQPARDVDVLFVNDNSADTTDNWPNGTEILTTYVQAFNHDWTRMPYIPEVATFIKEGLNKRATIFGCDEPDKMTIVYLPNSAYTYPSNKGTAKLQYSKTETRKIIENGMAVATQNGNEAWGACLGCAILRKTDTKLPQSCDICFKKYCYRA
ncbi:lysophospholipase [Aspergillus pseudoustus]|uniref:Lysophospholipase n=1 Tax=Aspergillus pseudoustus TaxID=1810923 RepID=A0ABR4ID54_9EURO